MKIDTRRWVKPLTWIILCMVGGCNIFEEPGPPSSCDDGVMDEEGKAYLEGAICVGDEAVCPDGRALCPYFGEIDGWEQVIYGCLGECIKCPSGTGICYNRDNETEKLKYFCVNHMSECFGDFIYDTRYTTWEDCPTAAKECMKGKD